MTNKEPPVTDGVTYWFDAIQHDPIKPLHVDGRMVNHADELEER